MRMNGKMLVGLVALAATFMLLVGSAQTHTRNVETSGKDQPEPADIEEQDPGYYFLMAEQAEARGDMEAVQHYYRKTLSLDPTAAYLYIRMANLMARNRRIADALILARMAVLFDPKNEEAYSMLGKVFTVTNDRGRAIEAYARALELKPEDKDLYIFIGHLQASEKHFEDAEKTFERMLKQFPDEKDGYWYLGKVYIENKQYDKAVQVFEELLQRRRDGASQVHVELGSIYMLKNEPGEAEKHFREAVKLDAFNINARLNLGQVLAAQKKYEESYLVFEELSKLAPSNLGIRIKMALVLAEQKQYDKAKEMLNKILASKPGWDQIRFHLGQVLKEQGKLDEAETEFAHIPKGAPTYLNSRIVMSLMFLRAREPGKSLRYIDEAIETDSQDPELYQIRGSILEELNRYQEALQTYKQALAFNPRNTKLRYAMGNVYEKSGRRTLGLREMEQILEETPDDAGALNFIGYTLLLMGDDLDRAEKVVRRASELKPDDGYIIDSLGWVLFKRGRVEEALSYLQKAAEKAQFDPIIADHLGDALRELGRHKEAVEAYRKSLNVNQENVVVRQKLEKLEKEIEREGN